MLWGRFKHYISLGNNENGNNTEDYHSEVALMMVGRSNIHNDYFIYNFLRVWILIVIVRIKTLSFCLKNEKELEFSEEVVLLQKIEFSTYLQSGAATAAIENKYSF